MAQRRCIYSLTRHVTVLLSSTPSPLHLETFPFVLKPTQTPSPKPDLTWRNLGAYLHHSCFYSAGSRDKSDEVEDDDGSDDVDSEEVMEDDDGCDDVDSEEVIEDDDDGVEVSSAAEAREYSVEEKESEAAAIGYKVVGPLEQSDRVFKPYEPVFAVVQIGSHQFKVSNGDSIFTERLKFCDVNDKLILNKVLLLGSSTQTIVGRPIVPDAAVHAVVEEHALDAKVIIFKKKRRKNYRRTKGHRQELTKLRITDILGIEKPELKVDRKHRKPSLKKEEKTVVAA